MKFNSKLRLIAAAQPSGVDEQQQINIAFVLFSGKRKTVVEYNFKDYDVSKKWKLYPAWKLLQTCKYFNCLATQQLTKNGCAKVGGPSDGDVSSISSGSSERPVGQKRQRSINYWGNDRRSGMRSARRKEVNGESVMTKSTHR